jgi:hypothetical protein
MAPRTAAVVALLFTLALITGCSMAHGDPAHPELNPHPKQRYEVTVTVDAPGPFDSVKGHVWYAIANPECTPKNLLEGVHNLPADVDRTIVLTRVDDHTYHGYFYRDLLQGEDYFGKGICRWEVSGAGANFMVHGLLFPASVNPFDIYTGHPLDLGRTKTFPFSVKQFFDRSLNDENALIAGSGGGADKTFDIMVTVKEVEP